MINVAFDIGFLAAPGAGSNHEDLLDYVHRIEEWNEYLENENFSFFALHNRDEIQYLLYQAELHIHNNHISTLSQKSKGLASDINKYFGLFLSKIESLRSIYGIQKVEWENVNTRPKIDQISTHSDLLQLLEEVIVVVALLGEHDSSHLSHILVIPKKVGSLIKVNARDVVFEVNTESNLDLPSREINSLESSVPVCKNFEELVLHLKEEQVLSHASSDKEVGFAIKIALFRHGISNGVNVEWNDVKIPFIGSVFRETCRKGFESGFLKPKEVIRAIVDVVNNINPDFTHLWKAKKGKKLIERDYEAWRYEVNRGTGARMHFWKGPHGKVELGCVQDHDSEFFPDLTTRC